MLRDGKKLIGVLRSYDQYGKPVMTEWLIGQHQERLNCFTLLANLVLMDTLERIQAGRLFAEVPRGLFIIRGENVVLLGEIVGNLTSIESIYRAQSKSANLALIRILTRRTDHHHG